MAGRATEVRLLKAIQVNALERFLIVAFETLNSYSIKGGFSHFEEGQSQVARRLANPV